MMKKIKAFKLALCSATALAVIALGGAYGYGLCRGYAAARAVIDANGTPEWHVVGVPMSEALPPAPKYYMPIFVHRSAWTVYGPGYIRGYNRVARKWAEDAVTWLRKGAEQGEAEAQRNLGHIYSYGDDLPRDVVEGVRWYRKAAEQGDAQAQFQLGVSYDVGKGVPENNAEAVKWYLKAAEQGRPGAQNNLGRMYQNGDGVEQDEVEALAWAIVAGERGVRNLLDLLQALDSYPHIRVRAEDRAEQLAAEIARQREARWRIPPAVPVEVDDISIVKSPIIMRGIYGSVKGTDGSRSAGVRGGASTVPPRRSTDMAVMGALRWFKCTQQEDGSWREAGLQTPTVTALVLLTYLAHGESPDSPEFGQTVMNAMRYLLDSRNEESSPGTRDVALGEQAIVTWALCEAYALTWNPYLGSTAEAGIATILSKQGKDGLWSESDRVKGVSASIWCTIALHAAYTADLSRVSVEAACRAAGDALLASLESPRPSRDMPHTILALQLMGHARKPAVRRAIEQLDDMTMDWEAPESTHPVSGWYFMTQLTFNQGGNIWKEWNRSFSPELLKHQTIMADAIDIPHADRRGETGYWEPPGLQTAYARTSSTALCCLMLEIYYQYRNSRMFRSVPDADPVSLDSADDVDIEIIQ